VAEETERENDEERNSMKLLLIVPSRDRGGAEHYSLEIAKGALERGWEVHAAVPQMKGTESLIGDFKADGIIHHPLDIPERHFLAMKEEPLWKNETFPQTGMVLRRMRALERSVRVLREGSQAVVQFVRTLSLLLQVRPDVVLVNICWATFGMGIILACGFSGTPTAVVFHSYPFRFSFRNSKVKAYNWARARKQKWITVSEGSRRLICGSFQVKPEEVLRIYNGIKQPPILEESNREGDSALRTQVRRELGVAETARLLLTVARLDSNKGHDDLIQTIPHIVREFHDVRFVWVGEGEQRDSLIEKCKEYRVLEDVLLLGYRSDVSRLVRSADLFVLPTRFEGLPFTLLEAMVHGLPVVASDAGGISEVIENGVHGLTVRVGDSCDLLEAIRWALRYPERMKEMARSARRRVLDFSEERMINEVLEVLRELSEAGSHRSSR